LFGIEAEGLEDDVEVGTDERHLENDADLSPLVTDAQEEPGLVGGAFSAAFFGWLVAGGTVVLLVSLLGVVCSLIGWDRIADWSETDAGTRRLLVGAWILLVLTMGLGAFSGGYASGRMVRSHGGRQGLGVWFFSWIAGGLIVALGFVADRKYDLTARIDWPSLPIAETDRRLLALFALVAILLVTLVGTLVGGAAGTRCHERLNRFTPRQHTERLASQTGSAVDRARILPWI
jgi:MFS family permease